AVPGASATPTTPSAAAPGSTRTAASPQVHGPNTSPRVDALAVHRGRTVAHATVRACDDRPGRLAVRAVVRRGSATRVARSHLVAESDGCWPYLLSFRLPHGGSGRVTVTLRLRDAAGAWSRPFVYRLARSRS
ncbi:MAG TPA: hypothetical protein VFL66_08540, partial [Gaiellaceae bacterium]|nr:hypothetical protein [Gaiellaceae bacterium]